jgi:hypothetical protein
MKIFVLAAAMIALTMGGAYAATASTAKGAPPTAEQKARFLKACEKYGTTTVCTCKAEQAMKLVDTDFMEVIIDSINGKATPVGDTLKYGVYISKSNAVCAPGM